MPFHTGPNAHGGSHEAGRCTGGRDTGRSGGEPGCHQAGGGTYDRRTGRSYTRGRSHQASRYNARSGYDACGRGDQASRYNAGGGYDACCSGHQAGRYAHGHSDRYQIATVISRGVLAPLRA